MKSASRKFSALATLVVTLTFFLSSCKTTGDVKMGGAASWAAKGFRLANEPEKQKPDPAIMHHKQSKGLITFKRTFVHDGED